MLFSGDTFKRKGFSFKYEVEVDEFISTPWEEHDGYGPVRQDQYIENKNPGERVLYQERGYVLFYDIQGAHEKAKRDGWGLSDENTESLAKRLGRQPTKGEIRAESVELDFQHLRGYCNNDWMWVTVRVTLLDADGEETEEFDALGGVESNSDEYLEEIRIQCADEIIYRVGEGATELVIPEKRIPLR